MKPDASVIIPTFDDWNVLQNCLDCLARQTIAQDRFEVIVCNNNNSAEVPKSLKLSPNTRVIHVPKPGSYAARNAGIRDAQTDIFFFTDSDCRPDRTWIECGLSALAGIRPIDRIAGIVELFPNGSTWTGPELYDRVFSLRQDVYSGKGWCATANLVTTRAAFDLVGPFDESSFSGGDRDWGLRASSKGSLSIYSPETKIRHPARKSFAELAKKCRRLIGKRHQLEVLKQRKRQSTFSFLLPNTKRSAEVKLRADLNDVEKAAVLMVSYQMNLVMFLEYFRLRYLKGKPRRS